MIDEKLEIALEEFLKECLNKAPTMGSKWTRAQRLKLDVLSIAFLQWRLKNEA